VTNELKKEISQLKEKIKEMQDSNTVLHQNYEKLSNKKKEVTIKKNGKYHIINRSFILIIIN